jgi:hypothetical protein
MNGSDDEQHDAHVKCYCIAIADGDAVEAAYDKQLAKAGSTDEPDPAYRAYVERVSRPWKDALPTSPPELLLAPIESWRGTSPIQAAKSRPDRNTVGSAASPRSRSPPEPRCPGWSQPTSSLVGAVLG